MPLEVCITSNLLGCGTRDDVCWLRARMSNCFAFCRRFFSPIQKLLLMCFLTLRWADGADGHMPLALRCCLRTQVGKGLSRIAFLIQTTSPLRNLKSAGKMPKSEASNFTFG